MAKHGKSYNAAAEKIDRATLYTPLQAAKLIKELDTAKFDETVEAHFRLGIDTRKADQNIRGSISLPHGTGKNVRVIAKRELTFVRQDGSRAFYSVRSTPESTGSFDMAIRVFPKNDKLPHRMDFALVKWA